MLYLHTSLNNVSRALMSVVGVFCLAMFSSLNLYAQNNEQKRRDHLADIIRLQDQPSSVDSFVSHHDKTWISWQQRTAELTLELFTPPGDGPFPVFITQWNHRGWAQVAVRRGYMGLVYAGADDKDDTFSYLALYPEHDWSTLMTRAWGAHRAIDYLYTLNHVDRSKIANELETRRFRLNSFFVITFATIK